MRVAFLGTGGALASAKRAHTSLLVEDEGLCLVDCSGIPTQALARAGADWRTLADVVLTHRHLDHIGGLPALVEELRIACRGSERPALRIWGPESALQASEALLGAAGLRSGEGPVPLELRPLPAERTTTALGSLSLTTFPVCHRTLPTLGLRLAPSARPEAALVYSADTEPCAALLAQATTAALLVHECSDLERAAFAGHTTLSQLEALLAELEAARLGSASVPLAPLGRPLESGALPAVRLVHLPPLTDAEERAVQARLEARFDDAVCLAEDGLALRL